MSGLEKPNKRIFDSKSVLIGTFIGGPIALIIFIYRNVSTYKDRRNALLSCLALAVIWIAFIFSPIHIPVAISSSLSLAIIIGAYQFLLQEDIKKHKEAKGKFISGWIAAVITFASLGLVVTAVYLDYKRSGLTFNQYIEVNASEFDVETYNDKYRQLGELEEDAIAAQIQVYEPSSSYQDRVNWLKVSDDNWKSAKEVIESMDEIDNLPSIALEENALLLEYIDLRLEETQLRQIYNGTRSERNALAIKDIEQKLDAKLDQIESLGSN